jgi:hypothetical protein
MTLHDVRDWVDGTKCVPTAFAAISGLPISKIMEAIRAEAADDSLTQFDEISPEHWHKALQRLGFDPHVDEAHAGETIDQFIATSHSPFPILVFAKDEALNVTHIFAVQGDRFVDCHTRGKICKFTETPRDMRGFKLKGEIFFE